MLNHRSSIVVAIAAVAGCTPGPAVDDADVYAPVVEVPDCRPDNDGIITADEMPVVVGAIARNRIGTNVPVDIDGTVGDDGVTRWDLTRPVVDIEPVGTFTVEEMGEQWFAGLFPNADFAAPLVPGNSQLGPLVVDDNGWSLLGGASREEDPPEGKTQIVYDTPSRLYPFPLQLGTTVTTTSRARNAVLLGIQTAFDDKVTVTVVRQGTVVLPDLELDNTLQVQVKLERTLVAGDVQQVSYHFVHECFGEVARFISEAVPLDQELDENFTTAREVWRLAL
ncbi:MAG TPA: hypothetical protein VGF99_16550 [Myxococcota bacterium]